MMSLSEVLKIRQVRNIDLATILGLSEASASRIVAGSQALTPVHAAKIALRLKIGVYLDSAGRFHFQEIKR